ncbi:MAG: hypothetical protein COA50_11690 [Flavobacteriaceae bacterium]|nr:MAG: hypothetical protein COA50_11690 [Flavobacteriaceae bacterium]
MKPKIKTTLLLLIFSSFIISSCVSTRVESSPHLDGVVNLECQKRSSWSYYWGLKQKRVDTNPEVAGTICPCREGGMSWVVVQTSFTDFLLSTVTIGIVNHRTVTYGCARAPHDDDDPDN